MNPRFGLGLLTGLVMLGLSIPAHAVELLGAGATFPYPFYAKINDVYAKKSGTKINYQSIGSGGGIQQLKNQTVDFGASDAFLNAEEVQSMPGKVAHIPTCLGAVAITFNLPGVAHLNLTDEVIAQIFLGEIKMWNDAKITKINPGVLIVPLPISTVHRSDGSGTSAIFTSYLAHRNNSWKTKVGAGKSVNWPNGIGGKGNAGVAGLVKQVPGSIGYVEQLYAKQNKMAVAAIRNDKGTYVLPSEESVSQAAGSITIPGDTCVAIVDTKVTVGYPISSFTWLLVYKDLKLTPEKAKALKAYLTWVIHDGQAYAEDLGYSTLPKLAVKKAEGIINGLTLNGKKF